MDKSPKMKAEILLCLVSALIILSIGTTVRAQASSLSSRQTSSSADQNAILVEQLGQVSPSDTGYLLIGPSNGNLAPINLGQRLLYGPNANKRASRRVSSFMPMRGRKDGRDEKLPIFWGNNNLGFHEIRLGNLEPATDSGSSGLTDGQSLGSGLMQAKLRRAFHPMRGKKSDTSFDEMDGESVDGLEP